ncbi:MAG: DinB family protein [Flavobacteriales bacterium]|nr:MAG: DinB family protein [Flavobacteriales bacterium]
MEVRRLIEEARSTLLAQRARAQALQHMPAERLLYRPAPEAWNVLEVFEHLNLSSGIYVRGLEAQFARKAARYRANPEFRPGWIGNWFTEGLKPQADGAIRWKMRTMKLFDPARQRGASLQSIGRFVDLCDRFIHLLEQASTTDLNKVRVTSSLGPLVRFKAGDVIRFPLAHQERHFIQIERLLRSAG